MDCEIVKVEQNSDDWNALRRARITASRVADVVARPDTKRYRQYQREMVLELLGHEFTEEDAHWFAHGREQEPRALAAYERKFDQIVEHNVFLISKKYDWLACSPDGIHDPDYDDGIEIKCRNLYKNYRMHVQMAKHFEGSPKAAESLYRWQIQTAMLVTGLKRWGFVNYYEGEDYDGLPIRKLHRVWIPRDEAMINKIELACLDFMKQCYEIAGEER